MKRICYLICFIFFLIMSGLAVQYIPRDKVVLHSKMAFEIFGAEDYWPLRHDRVLDNYTDAAMMLISSGTSEEKGWTAFFSNPLYTVHNVDPNWIDLFPLESVCRDDMTRYLIHYQRYWHGYQIILRPLLYFTDYSHIRQMNLWLQIGLFAAVLFLMFKKRARGLMLAWIVSYIIFCPPAMAANMTYSMLYYIGAIALILMLSAYDWIKLNWGWPLFFALIGISSCFFDFLTYPIVPLSLALTTLFYLEPQNKFWPMFGKMMLLVFCWGAGYAGMWALNCLYSTLATDQNTFLDAYLALIHRASPSTDFVIEGQEYIYDYPHISAMIATFEVLIRPAHTRYAIIGGILVALMPLLWKFKLRKQWLSSHYVELLAFCGIACSFPVYCLIICGHPLQHSEYTYRLWVAFFFPLIAMLNFWWLKSRKWLNDSK